MNYSFVFIEKTGLLMKVRTILIICLTVLFGNFTLSGQGEPITLSNASFEDMPRPGKPPRGWVDCGFQGETPPDVQPDPTFSVSKMAVDGGTYLGMVVRDNDTWESVSQKLSEPLKKGQCYEFSLHLARSELYISVSRTSEETANYTTPAKLRIYGGFGNCDKQFMLAETKVIINHRWLEYKFRFEPIADYTYLVLEAFYNTPTLFPYNGNVLVDKASQIVPVPCDEEPILAEVEPEPPAPEVETRPEPVTTTPADSPTPDPAEVSPVEELAARTPTPVLPDEPKTGERSIPAPQEIDDDVRLGNLRRSELKEGTTVRIDKLYFQADSTIIEEESFSVLNEIYRFLDRNKDVVVEIGGHTNNLPPAEYCDRLSEARAKAVADYLASKGINKKRLQFKGYGKRYPIADNRTTHGRKQNQRVEIKILSFNG